eukprot:symbB.v1.2.019981.t1/scaffold1654.1/size107508/6
MKCLTAKDDERHRSRFDGQVRLATLTSTFLPQFKVPLHLVLLSKRNGYQVVGTVVRSSRWLQMEPSPSNMTMGTSSAMWPLPRSDPQGVPPPPPPAAYPWPEEGGAGRAVEGSNDPGAGLDLPRLKLQQRPNLEQTPKAEVHEEDAGTKKFRKRLSAAVDKGSGEEGLLLDAQKVGMQGPEVRWARDTLLAAEAADFRKNTVRQVEDAIESLDYWKLQAAMQAVIGCGLGKEQAPRLKQAMRTHKIRSEAARELRKAAQARDKARLRTAIEGALKVHTEETVVKKARDALRALQAREAAREELRKATAAKESAKLKSAILAAEKVGLHDQAPGMLGEDPKEKEELAAAREELRLHAMTRLSKLAESEDVENFAKGLEELADHGVPKQEWHHFKKRHSQLKVRQECQTKLALATKARNKEHILAAMKEAKESQVEDDCEVMQIARQTMIILEAEETMAKTRAEVAEELSRAVQGEDQRRLLAAITAADAAGFTSTEVSFARERLRRLRARVGAGQELREAAHSADMYSVPGEVCSAPSACTAMPSGALFRGSVASRFFLMALLQLEALPLAEEHHSVEEHRWPGASGRQLEDPAGSPGLLSDFIGQRIYFRNGNMPLLDEIDCIEGADETIDVQGICDSMSLSACLQRRNESLLPGGCFTMELLETTKLVFNPGGSATACQAPAFCDIICVKLPPGHPGLLTTLPATSTTSTSTVSVSTTTSQSWTFTSSSTTHTVTSTTLTSTTSTTSSTRTSTVSDTTTLSTSSSSTSSVTTITTTRTTTSSSTSTSTSEMELVNTSNRTFNESQTSTTEFIPWSLIDSEESDASPDQSDESDTVVKDEGHAMSAMSMSDHSKIVAATREGSPSPSTLSRGLATKEEWSSDFTEAPSFHLRGVASRDVADPAMSRS